MHLENHHLSRRGVRMEPFPTFVATLLHAPSSATLQPLTQWSPTSTVPLKEESSGKHPSVSGRRTPAVTECPLTAAQNQTGSAKRPSRWPFSTTIGSRSDLVITVDSFVVTNSLPHPLTSSADSPTSLAWVLKIQRILLPYGHSCARGRS